MYQSQNSEENILNTNTLKNLIHKLTSSIDLTEYNYELPKEKIAQFPLEQRDESKLIKVEKISNNTNNYQFKNLPEIIKQNSLLIVNNSKVIQARILLQKPSGGRLEFLLLEPVYPSLDPQIALKETNRLVWKVIIGGKKIKVGLSITTNFDNHLITFNLLEKNGNEGLVEILIKNTDLTDNTTTFGDILEKLGKIPLPPYMERDTIANDTNSYQTVYAVYEGSVAAPTAGLHFTENVINKLKTDKNVSFNNITLHVGAGTFNPIKNDSIEDHLMHTEKITVNKSLIEEILAKLKSNDDIIAVGTTTTRTIESLYWIGVKLYLIENIKQIQNSNIDTLLKFEILDYLSKCLPKAESNDNQFDFSNLENVFVSQWDSYILSFITKEILHIELSNLEALELLLKTLDTQYIDKIIGATQLLIIPQYQYKIINVLITNFHAPKSTLILLVSAFLGRELWKKYYDIALQNNYRFLSYGDSSILLLNQ